MRAHIICTAAISGQVISAVHSSEVPSCAPVMEYVAMPDGSSSAAPVINPGPRAPKKRLIGFGFFGRFIRDVSGKNKVLYIGCKEKR